MEEKSRRLFTGLQLPVSIFLVVRYHIPTFALPTYQIANGPRVTLLTEWGF